MGALWKHIRRLQMVHCADEETACNKLKGTIEIQIAKNIRDGVGKYK